MGKQKSTSRGQGGQESLQDIDPAERDRAAGDGQRITVGDILDIALHASCRLGLIRNVTMT